MAIHGTVINPVEADGRDVNVPQYREAPRHLVPAGPALVCLDIKDRIP